MISLKKGAAKSTADEASASAAETTGGKKPLWGPKSAWAQLTERTRLIIQIVFLIFSPQTFSLAFNGVKQLFAALGQLDAFDANSFLILLVLLLAFTVVFGRFFCGYICAFGAIGDILYKIVDLPLRKLNVKRPRLPQRVEDMLRCLKYVVLLFFLVTSFIGLSSIVSVYSPWTAFGRLLALNISDLNVVGLALLVIIAIGMICKERFFCEFLCPLGAIFSLLPVLSKSRMRRHLPTCDNCGTCERSCPVAIMPQGEDLRMGECIACDRCESRCPHDCIGMCSAEELNARMEAAVANAEAGKPVRNQGPDDVVKRSHTKRAIILAVAVFVVLWLLKAINYLPTFW